MKTGDLVRIVAPPYDHPELYWTLGVIIEHRSRDERGIDKFLLHCLFNGNHIVTSATWLEPMEEE